MISYRRKVIYIVLLFSLTCLFACATSSSDIGIGELVLTPEGDYSMVSNVVLNNPELSGHIQIVDINARMKTDIMEAMVSVINKYDSDYNFEYRYQWFDKDGFEIRSVKEHWRPVLISGKETKVLPGVAPSPEARKFKINIRASHPVD